MMQALFQTETFSKEAAKQAKLDQLFMAALKALLKENIKTEYIEPTFHYSINDSIILDFFFKENLECIIVNIVVDRKLAFTTQFETIKQICSYKSFRTFSNDKRNIRRKLPSPLGWLKGE